MKGDLHIHSKYSPDSSMEPELIAKFSLSIGLGFIAITDHNAFRKHKFDGLITINGEEISSRDGHILGLFIQGEVKKGLSQEETVDAIRDLNGIAVVAHPYRKITGVGKRFRNIYDAVEAKNGRCSRKCNERALSLSREMLKPFTAGSDAHFYEEIGRVYLEVEGSDEESLRKEIISGNSKLSGNDLSLKGSISLYLKLGRDYVSRGFRRI